MSPEGDWMSRATEQRGARLAQLAAQLADFEQHPPEANLKAGPCALDRKPVPVMRGLACRGHDEGGPFTAVLHLDCADAVQEAKEAR
jgi:hypothetical protein